VVRLASIPLLSFALWRLGGRSPKGAEWPLLILVAVLALPLAQLAPLPPAIWSHLHGRQTVVDAYKAAGVGPPWLPISLTPDETWNAVLGLVPPAAMFCAVLTLDTKSRVSCARALVVLALLSVGLEMLQTARGESSALRLYEAAGPGAVEGFFANSDHQASFLASAMPLAGYLCMSSAGRRGRVVPAILVTSAITLTFILAIAATRSRAGVVLAMAMTLGVLAVSVRTAGIEQVQTARRRIALAFLAALACAGALATMFSFAPLAERFQSDLGDVRPQVFRLVTAAGGSYAPLGSGVGSFETVYRMLESAGSLIPEYINHAHNDFLETWLEAGWPGIFLIGGFLCWWITASVMIWRGARTPNGGLALAGAVVVGGLLAHSLVDYPLRTPALATLLAFACGVMIQPAPHSSGAKRQGVVSSPGTPEATTGRPGESDILSRRVWPLSGGIPLAGFTVGLTLWLTWACFAQTAAGYERSRDPDLALKWAPHDADLLSRGASFVFESAKAPPDYDRAAALAKRALKEGPLDTRALRVLGFVADHQGRMSQANELMAIAGKRSLRDIDTQWWLFDASMKRADYTDAFTRADAILRQDSETGDELFPAIIAKLADPRAALALTRRLALGPPWRRDFLAELGRRPGTRDLIAPTLIALRATRHPATEEEVGVLLSSEIDAGDYVRAFDDWRRLVPSARAASRPSLYNGRFRADAGEPPFNWKVARDAAGTVSLAASDDGAGLRAVPVDRDADSPLISELLVLPPGGYRLNGEVRVPGAPGMQSDGFVWSLRCAGSDRLIGQTETTRAGDRWAAFEATVVVPSTKCAGQWLDLLRRSSLSDAAIQTPVLFDRLTLAAQSLLAARAQ